MEHRFRETAHKAVRIGDRLSRMEAQRARAAETMDLLEFFKVNIIPRVEIGGVVGVNEDAFVIFPSLLSF